MRLILFIILILFMTSCSSVNDPAENEIEELIPLEIGNAWVFDHNWNPDEIMTDTLSVVRDTLIGDNVWYKIESNFSFLNTTLNGYYINHEDGLYSYTGSEEITNNTLVFKATDAEKDVFYNDSGSFEWLTTYKGNFINQQFDVSTKMYSVEYLTYTFPNINRSFKVDQSYQFQRIISPKIGFVRWEAGYLSILNDSTLTLRQRINFELKEFITAD